MVGVVGIIIKMNLKMGANNNCVIMMTYIKQTASATNQIKHDGFSYNTVVFVIS